MATPRYPKIHVNVPWETKKAQEEPTEDDLLSSLWSTDPTDDPGDTEPAGGGLEGLWMGRVAAETGQHYATGDLESLWLREISTDTGTTASLDPNEISFDEVGIDEELARFRGAPRVARGGGSSFRVDRPVAATPSRATMTISEVRERAQRPPAPTIEPQPRPSALRRAEEYSSRRTAYDVLMDDD